ncbi:2-amino-4-hydroxy-6-hydroxymethyldihydropteridine diphosphokinase [Pseudoxanthomonas beigongshangi]|jgi:7,8-dihydro-6-hydroxymethylpterin-pyrophosphokinase
MSPHRYLLILGSGTDGEAQLARARAALADEGRILALSPVVTGNSVVAGDPHRYANQALLLETALERTAFNARLKSLEIELGRHPGDAACAIDLDLAREYGADDELCWENPAKLEHPVFVDLAERVAPIR